MVSSGIQTGDLFSSRKTFITAGVVVGHRFAEFGVEFWTPEFVRARTFVVGPARELQLAVGGQPPANPTEDPEIGRTRNDQVPDGPKDSGFAGIRASARHTLVFSLDGNAGRVDLLVSDAAVAVAGGHQQVAQHPGQSTQQSRLAPW